MEKRHILDLEEVVSEEVAIKSIQKFVAQWKFEKIEDYKVSREYPNLLQAVMSGLVIFDKELKPTQELINPIFSDKGTLVVDKIDYRTRIKPQDLANITEGVDVQNKPQEYILRCMSYITRQAQMILNKFDKFDYKVCEQIASCFL